MTQRQQREEIGERVRRARESLGWTQGELAKKARVAENTIGSIEKGKHRPQPEKLRQVLDALGLAPTGDTSAFDIDKVPGDAQVFLAVAAQRLAALSEQQRVLLLARLYPRLLVEDIHDGHHDGHQVDGQHRQHIDGHRDGHH